MIYALIFMIYTLIFHQMYLDYDDRLSYFYAIKVRLHIQARLYGKQLFTSGKFKVYPYKNVVAFYKHALFFYWSQRRSSFESNWVLYISSSFWLLGVESRDFFSCWERKNCLQSWANLQNDNYFHSKCMVICPIHVVTWIKLGALHFL